MELLESFLQKINSTLDVNGKLKNEYESPSSQQYATMEKLTVTLFESHQEGIRGSYIT